MHLIWGQELVVLKDAELHGSHLGLIRVDSQSWHCDPITENVPHLCQPKVTLTGIPLEDCR